MLTSARQRLTAIASWRVALGDDLLQQDSTLNDVQLTALVDRTIERCLALRLCADRGIIPVEMLTTLVEATDSAARCATLCRRLFGGGDGELIPADSAVRPILTALADRADDGPYAGLPLASLGAFHEAFCNRPLKIAAGRCGESYGRAGGRKANGSYYTPPPLAEYLVDRALGPLLATRTPDDARDLAILDPACGGGIFLLTAYRYLIRWYRAAYAATPRRYADRLQERPGGSADLSAAERRRIVRDHLYGVDRDPQALETTRLTLLVASTNPLHGDPVATPPSFSENLRQGDALLDPAWFDDTMLQTLHADERAALLPLDWHDAFPAIMARGGFDLVIGNPPFLSYSGRQVVAVPATVRQVLGARYRRAGWPAAHAYFIERAVATLSRRRIAFVVPDQVGHLAGYAPTRTLLPGLIEARYWGEGVFAGAITPILTFVVDRDYRGPATITEQGGQAAMVTLRAGEGWHGGADTALLAKLCRDGESLGALVGDVGVHSGNCARHLIVPRDDPSPDAVPILEGRAIGRYRCAPPERALRLGYRPQPGEYRTIRSEGRYREAAFLIRQTAPRPIVGPRRHATYFRNSLLALYPPRDGRAIEYLVGLLNSRLFGYFYAAIARDGHQRAFPQVKIAALRRLPIKRLDLHNRDERQRHDTIVALVRQLLALHERCETLTAEAERCACEEAIAATDRQLDHAIYGLYGLDEADIAIIERES